jgi:cytoplasmic iron level regulating protein YaaA (DUF328/UPF0246 family)
MLFLLSPAKTLDYESRVPATVARKATEPQFTEQAAQLITVLRQKTPSDIGWLMDLSENLAVLNVERYAAWQPQATSQNSKPAVLAFNGDVYEGLQARSLKAAELNWAQQHIVILSGLYGVLRPLDRLQPYRLEMGTALQNPRGKDLYAWWGDTVAAHLNGLQAEETAPVVVNLASVEYSRVALRKTLRARVVECVFEETNADGSHQIISFFAKRARGLMARFAIEQRARSVKALQAFNADGYAFDKAASTPNQLVFRRPRPPALKARAAAQR